MVICRVTIEITHIRGLMTPPITTHEPPSTLHGMPLVHNPKPSAPSEVLLRLHVGAHDAWRTARKACASIARESGRGGSGKKLCIL